MSVVRKCTLGLLVLLSLGGLLLAQPGDDPLIKEFERYVAAVGGRRNLQEDADFQRSRAGWDEARREIAEGIATQDQALAGSPSELEKASTLFASRAKSRGRPVDHYLHGRILGLTGHLEDAYAAFTEALKQDRFFYWAWDGLGVYHSNKGNWNEAVTKFDRVLQLNRNYLKSAFGRAQCLFQLGETSGAAMQLREILDNPAAREDRQVLDQARLLLAESYRSNKDYDAAIRELTALEKDGLRDDVRLYAMRAWCSKQLERWSEAIRDYDRILALDAGEFRYLVLKGDCLVKLGRNAEAIKSYEGYLAEAKGTIDSKEEQSIRDLVEQLRSRPAVENPKQQALNLQDLCNNALNSPHLDKRREAIFMLARHPQVRDPAEPVFNLLRQTFSKAILDDDPMIAAKALEQMNERFWDPVRLFNVTRMLARRPYGKDPLVRNMACYQLQNYDPKAAVPVLIMALQEEPDLGVFRSIHESLNSMTLAWIDRVLPDDLEVRDVAATRGKWLAWYKKHRDVYRRNEPDDFKLD